MKLIHLSDLHLGKRVYEYSMLEDQEFILRQILNVIDQEKPDGVILAGDIYDKSIPPAEAVSLFDDFLVGLAKRNLETFVISGNHDSAERIAFGSRIMEAGGVHLSPVYKGNIAPVTLEDEYGPVNFYLLPFLKPVQVRKYNEDAEVGTYTDALKLVVDKMGVNPAERNVLVTHQFVTGATRSESEDVSVGGSDNVDASVFADFDYVALGHLHSPQNCGSQKIRYCGTPLKYSFSEANDTKSVTVVELAGKGELTVRTVPLKAKRDLVELRGKYMELMLRSFYEGTTYQEDYVHITLTDEEDIPDAIGLLRTVYHNLMKLNYDNKRTRSNAVISADAAVETKSPFELFADFYQLQNNQPMSDGQASHVKELIENVFG